jgi:hypothetical protein
VLDATEPVPTCIQAGAIGLVDGTEDCLYLNVFTPRVRNSLFEFILSKYGTKFLNSAKNSFSYITVLNVSTYTSILDVVLQRLNLLGAVKKFPEIFGIGGSVRHEFVPSG